MSAVVAMYEAELDELRAEIERLKNQILQLATKDGRTVVITGDLHLASDTQFFGSISTHPEGEGLNDIADDWIKMGNELIERDKEIDLLKAQLQESVGRLQGEKEHLLFLLRPFMKGLPDGAILASCSGGVYEMP